MDGSGKQEEELGSHIFAKKKKKKSLINPTGLLKNAFH